MKKFIIYLVPVVSFHLSAQQSYNIAYTFNHEFKHDVLDTSDFKTARDIFCVRCERRDYEFVEREIEANKKACFQKFGNDGIHCDPMIFEMARATLHFGDLKDGESTSPKGEGIHDCLPNNDGSFSLYKMTPTKQKVDCPPDL